MEGFNWWGAFTFVMPIALVIIIGVIAIITSILDGVDKLIKRIGGTHGRIKRKTS
ncbi:MULTISPECIES: hypothetical protein [Clostridium]|uniref:hypothetical protein n=1 Tax=Clostridium TaxID=1485 RepID=UPI0008216504|nr:hypothetical protein [uncultured Clostridium sp.]SCJ88606.1 Uncharacterised protein [uncultured Clostridium sp.]